MGMFDTVVVAEKLPFNQEMIDAGLDKTAIEFQTKDLDNLLDLYFIQNGKLYIQKYKKSDPDEEDLAAKPDPYQEEIKFHGEINFYTYEMDVNEQYDYWIEYNAIFTHGNLEKIDLVKFEKNDTTEKKQRLKIYAEQELKIRNLWYNKYLKFNRIKYWISDRIIYISLMRLRSFIDKLIRYLY